MTVALHVVWERCSVTNPATGEDRILSRGDEVPDWVDDFTRSTLASIGAARWTGDAAGPASGQLMPVELPELPPARPPATPPAAVAPARSASKAEWVDFAVGQGASREDAEKATRDDLIAAYGTTA